MSRPIALVLPSFGSGGAERVVLNLAAGLATRGETVRLIVLDGRGPLRDQVDPRVEIVDLGRRRARTAAVRLARELRRRSPSVLMSSQTHLHVLLALLRPLLPSTIRLVLREPAFRPDDASSAWSRRVRSWALGRADAVIASSETMRAQLTRMLGPGTCVVAIPNPVDITGLRSGAVRGTNMPGAHHASGDSGTRAVIVGRLVGVKGHADLLEAMARPGARNVSLTVIGDGPLRAQLEQQMERLGLGGRVRFVGHIDLRDQLAAVVAHADVLVHPSHAEGMPNTVLEALALGTPVLATSDLPTLVELAGDVDTDAVQLVARQSLSGALGATPRQDGMVPRPSLLPPHFATDAVIERLLSVIRPEHP